MIADGAMGTLLYANGIDCCFEELNVSQPEQISTIHDMYLQAGAQVIQTNTYAANYIKLQRYGLEDQVKEITRAAVTIAKQAAKSYDAYVVGTIGGHRGIQPNSITIEEIKRSFREQLYCLLLEEVDGILLETFYDLHEIETVLAIARKETDLPIIAQISLQEVGVMQDRTPVNDALLRLEQLGANVVGLNCRLGPHHMLLSLEQVQLPTSAYLSAYPNASLPTYMDGKFHFEGDAAYFRKNALAFRNQGVRLIGGCCGTTPEHIHALATELKLVKPITEKIVKLHSEKIEVKLTSTKRLHEPLEEIVQKRKSVIVELDPPKKLDTSKFFAGAKALKSVGIDAITLADNSLATPRVCNTALGHRIQTEIDLRPLVHITCRDRNIIGLQSHLMGLHTLGLHDVLAITGDPARVGNFPGASSVYDVSSFELIQMIKQLNEGLSFSGSNFGQKANFSVAAAFNPHVRSLEKAVKRLERKIACGADYFITQPIFSEDKLLEVYEATKHLAAPIYVGIMPLTSSKNAEFLHNEVPGIKISQSIRNAFASCEDQKTQASNLGIDVAKNLIDVALELFNGIYIITPFLRYEMSVELVKYVNEKQQRRSNYVQSFIN